MKTNKYLLTIGLLMLSSSVQASPDVATKLVCTIKSVTPNLNNILNPAGFLQVGATTEIDTTINEITEMVFSNGGELGLSGIGAKLAKVSKADSTVTQFEGSRTTSRNQYKGILRISADLTTAVAHLQVLKRSGSGLVVPASLMQLGQADLECVAK